MPWRVISNQNTQIARNALRHEVVPILTKSVDRDLLSVDSFSTALEEDASFTARSQKSITHFLGYLDRPALGLAPVALARRALVAWLAVHGLMQSMSAPSMDLLLESILRKGVSVRHSVQGVFIVSDDRFVRIEEEVESTPIEGLVSLSDGDQRILPSGATLALRQVEVDSTLRSRLNNRSINPQDSFYCFLWIFQAKTGLAVDRFRPFGRLERRSLRIGLLIADSGGNAETCRLSLGVMARLFGFPDFLPPIHVKF